MAKSSENNDAAITPENKPQKTNKAIESTYSAAELISAARTKFEVSPEIVGAALKIKGKAKATLTEATQIVKEFMERKVM